MDLKRLESLNPKGDAEWQAFLIKGYKQSGASKETITAMEDHLISQFPKSEQASEIVQDRWQKANKEPEDQTDAVAWAKYDASYEQAVKKWVQEFPEDTDLQRYSWFYAIYDDDKISETEGIAALDVFLKATEEYTLPQAQMWSLLNAASFLAQHGWQPGRAIELVNQAKALSAKQAELSRQNDDLSSDELKNLSESEISQNLMFDGLLLKAAKQAAKPGAAQSIRALVESSPPADKKFLSAYWRNRARLAALDNHKQDALAYYQLALQSRSEPPKAYHGKLQDDDMDEAHALWKELGGTETAWAVWSKPPSAKPGEATEGRWEKPTKEIPTFELSDLSGKTTSRIRHGRRAGPCG